jgi:hypothetical protein
MTTNQIPKPIASGTVEIDLGVLISDVAGPAGTKEFDAHVFDALESNAALDGVDLQDVLPDINDDVYVLTWRIVDFTAQTIILDVEVSAGLALVGS